MPYLTASDLKISCFFSDYIVAIRDIQYAAEFNHHSTVFLDVVLSDNVNTTRLENEQIIIQNKHSGNLIFNGIIETLEKETYNDVTTMKVFCKSYSSLLDITPKFRTFQYSEDKYKDILRFAYKDFDGGVIVPKDENIAPLILQYDENDWEFTLRMVTALRTIAIVDDYADFPSVCIGFVDGQPCSFDKNRIKTAYVPVTKPLKAIKEREDERLEYRYLHATSGNVFRLGDYYNYEGKKYIVHEINMQLLHEQLVFEYKLGTEFRPESIKQLNIEKHGVVLSGKVIDVHHETLKVHFDIDPEQSKERAMWFHYRPDTNNVFYSMPEIGAKVMVKYSNNMFSVITCIHDENADFPDENERYFNLTRGQTLGMLQGQLFFEDNSNNLSMSDNDGIFLNSKQRITISAEGNVNFAAEKIKSHSLEQTKFNVTENVDGIDMALSEIDLYATDMAIASDGTNDKDYPKRFKSEPTSISSEFAAVVSSTTVSKINVG